MQSANLQSTDKVIALSGRDIKLTATACSAIPNPSEDNQDVRYVTSTLPVTRHHTGLQWRTHCTRQHNQIPR
ncbi:hypothetical protein J4727_12535 [Providencia rettgeri]|uniref:Uncharacterized protein n=1 Tax=Providencia rettgeri TaxID=587 RepID=A0A939NKE5_PRORE|nr:hypothetical protein [Providencia rettgeri]